MSSPNLFPAGALGPIEDELGKLRPLGAQVVDIHTHLGNDEDGMSLDPEGLVELLDAAAAEQAVVFPLHDPERVPSYRLPNDRVLRWAEESDGRFIPFCRLDPMDDPIAEAERCLELGARGIKLHPRAQAFSLVGMVEPIFALAEQAHVPILIHAGRGLPDAFGAELVEVAQRHPGAPLIMAHLGVAGQGELTEGLRHHPAAVYDTSWLNAYDLLSLLARVPLERVVFGSDPPYGRTTGGLFMLLRTMACLGVESDLQREVLGGAARKLIAGEELIRPTAPRAPQHLVVDHRLARVHTTCLIVFGAAITGNAERALDMLHIARMACREPSPGAAGPALERIATLLEASAELLREHPDTPRMGVFPVFLAMAVAATEVPQTRPA